MLCTPSPSPVEYHTSLFLQVASQYSTAQHSTAQHSAEQRSKQPRVHMLSHTAGWLCAAAAAAYLSAAAAQTTEVDYIIVGGGTAGCALAARLCEGFPDAQIALLERGNPRSADAVCSQLSPSQPPLHYFSLTSLDFSLSLRPRGCNCREHATESVICNGQCWIKA